MKKLAQAAKRTICFMLIFLLLFTIIHTPPPAQAVAVTATAITLIVALLTGAGIVFSSESQAQQLAQHVYWELPQNIRNDLTADSPAYLDINWQEVGQDLADRNPLATAIVTMAAPTFQALTNAISNIFTRNVPEFGSSAVEVHTFGQLTGIDFLNAGNWQGNSYMWDGVNIRKPLTNVVIAGHAVISEIRSYPRPGVPHIIETFLYINGVRRSAAFGSLNNLFLRLNRDTMSNSILLHVVSGGGATIGSYNFPFGLQDINAINAQTVNIDTPPWQRWTCWDTFLAEGYDPSLARYDDIIRSLMTGNGNVELLVQNISGTGTAGVQTPEGRNRQWQDTVGAPGTWTGQGAGVMPQPVIWDSGWIREKHPDGNIQQNADGSYVVTDPDGRITIYTAEGEIVTFRPGNPPKEIRYGTRNIVTEFDGIITTPISPTPGVNPNDRVVVIPDYDIITRPDRTGERRPRIITEHEVIVTPEYVVVISPAGRLISTRRGDIPGEIIITDGNYQIAVSPAGVATITANPPTSNPPGTGDGADTDTQPGTQNPRPPDQSPGAIFAMFPFCIPWDIYNIIVALTAEPIAPRWEIDLIPFVDADTTMVIDFEIVEPLRQIFRWTLLISFIIGLAIMTRKYIWTGGG